MQNSERLTQLQENDKPVVIYTTCPSLEEAERIGGELVERGQSACVNILPQMVSIYCWEGQRQRDEEVAMIVKTRLVMADAVIATIKDLHPYDVPAALVLPAVGGNEDFVNWIAAQAQPA